MLKQKNGQPSLEKLKATVGHPDHNVSKDIKEEKELGDKERVAFKSGPEKNNTTGVKDAKYNHDNKRQVCLGGC